MVQETVDIEDIISIDEQESIDDELDLVNLVSNNANNANQYLLFLGSDAQYYAMNVSKIEELVSFKDIEIAYNHDKNRILMGTADIRGEIVSLINFDKWMGNEVSEDEYYKIVILASFGSKRFTMLVKDVEGITAVDASNMVDNSMDNSKSSFICKINIEGSEKLCTVFDSDMLLFDIYDGTDIQKEIDSSLYSASKKSNKIVLFADDSKYIRTIVEKLFIQLELQYKIYKDGQELLDDIVNFSPLDIGLFITDLEMPRASGRDVIEHIRDDNQYEDINIIVHTNMSSDIMSQDLIKSNVAQIIDKVDMLALANAIEEYII